MEKSTRKKKYYRQDELIDRGNARGWAKFEQGMLNDEI